MAHPFEHVAASRARPKRRAYWRDVGTVDAYWAANLDLTDTVPELDMYDRDWPIWTYQEQLPPAKFVLDEDGRARHGGRLAGLRRLHHLGRARCAARCCSPSVHVHSYAEVEEAGAAARGGRRARAASCARW